MLSYEEAQRNRYYNFRSLMCSLFSRASTILSYEESQRKNDTITSDL